MGAARVWVDVLTPKQVLFFTPVIQELRDRGCEVLATSRKYRELEPVARMSGLDLEYVGERGGESVAEQLVAATQRQLNIIPMIKAFRPDVAASVASGVCARVAYGFRTRHVAVNDSPHSEVAGMLSLPLTHRLLCPWVIPSGAWRKFGILPAQITRYRALDPAAWLKRPGHGGPVPSLRKGRKTVTVRVEESYAPYMAGTDRSLTGTILRRLAESFPEANLVALCRYGDQLEAIEREFGESYLIPSEAVDGRGLLEATDLFIGMGGTMSAEAGLMGVPTVSAFQGTLYTETYLKSVGLLVKSRDPEAIVRHARRLLRDEARAAASLKARRVLAAMEDPVPKVVKAVMESAPRPE